MMLMKKKLRFLLIRLPLRPLMRRHKLSLNKPKGKSKQLKMLQQQPRLMLLAGNLMLMKLPRIQKPLLKKLITKLPHSMLK